MQLFNDDAIKILKSLPDESIDLIVTDPPYRTTPHGNCGNAGGMLKTKLSRQGKIFEHNDVKITDYAPEFFRILKDGTHCYVMTNHYNLLEMLTVFTDVGFHFVKSLIWDKTNKIMGKYYMSQFEYILFFRKGTDRSINNAGTPDILRIPNKKSKYNGTNAHDTEKPVELMRILIENSSNEGDLVCDPFLGIGATGVAAIETGRDFVGSEIDEGYFKIAQQRIEDVENSADILDFSNLE